MKMWLVVRELHPLQQGLRPIVEKKFLTLFIVRELHPLQQGLRQLCELAVVSLYVSSESYIHYNKD